MRTSRRRSIRTIALGAALLAPLPVYADAVDNLASRVVELEARVQQLDAELKPQGPVAETAERRLIDAQVLYELKNYDAASIVLLDVVEKYPNSSAYPEALYFLADALYLQRDFLSARRYFEKEVALGPQGKYYQEALERLIELSLYTGDSSPVEGYFAKLAELPSGNQRPTVPYVKGKFYFQSKRYDEAVEVFQTIPVGSPYWFQSQYFLGAIRVALGKYPDAIQTYEALLRAAPKSDADKRVVELTHLALARIHYEQGELPGATGEYAQISQDSDLFSEALYEQAWVSIKDKDYQKAFLSLDLLLTVKPEGPQVPELKLLLGNLHIRRAEWDEATAVFTNTRNEYEGIRNSLEDTQKKQGDLAGWFRDQIGKNMDKFDLISTLPPEAAKWVAKDPDVEKLGGVLGDVGELERSLTESEEILGRLEKALSGPQKVNVFSDLAHARAEATETTNQLYEIEGQLLQGERDLVAPVVADAERAQLQQVSEDRQRLQKRLADLPHGGANSYEARIDAAKAQFEELDKRAVELNVLISSFAAERVAIERYFHDSGQDQKQDVADTFARSLAEIKASEEQLGQAYSALHKDINDAVQSVGVDDSQMQAEDALKRQVADANARERDFFAQLRNRLGPAERTKAEQIDSILQRARGAEEQVARFNGRIDGLIDERLQDVKVTMAEQKQKVAQYRQVLDAYHNEAIDIGGGVSAESFKRIADRFYQIVIRSDVGIIDVAWALKQNRTDDNSRLTREKKRELKTLDDEFKEVLKE